MPAFCRGGYRPVSDSMSDADKATSTPAISPAPAAASRAPTQPFIIGSTFYLRVVAATAIVWFHIPGVPGREYAAPGLMAFLCLSFMQAGQRQAFGPALRRRTQRLMLPWLAWWLIYAAARVRIDGGILHAVRPIDSFATFMTWPSAHLWYLPFVYVNGTLVQLARIVMTPLHTRLKVALSLGSGVVMLLLLPQARGLSWIATMWWLALPTIGLGVTYGYALRLDWRRRRFSFLAIAAAVWVGCVPNVLGDRYETALAYSVGALLMLLCVVRIPRPRIVTRLAALTLGVYLVHPLAMWILWRLIGFEQPHWITLSGTTLLSFTIVAAMRRLPYARAIV